jgi:hypothetical protein
LCEANAGSQNGCRQNNGESFSGLIFHNFSFVCWFGLYLKSLSLAVPVLIQLNLEVFYEIVRADNLASLQRAQ